MTQVLWTRVHYPLPSKSILEINAGLRETRSPQTQTRRHGARRRPQESLGWNEDISEEQSLQATVLVRARPQGPDSRRRLCFCYFLLVVSPQASYLTYETLSVRCKMRTSWCSTRSGEGLTSYEHGRFVVSARSAPLPRSSAPAAQLLYH